LRIYGTLFTFFTFLFYVFHEQVGEDDVALEWIEVAKTIASAGPENLEQVMDSLQVRV
jgi:hypothetical protein